MEVEKAYPSPTPSSSTETSPYKRKSWEPDSAMTVERPEDIILKRRRVAPSGRHSASFSLPPISCSFPNFESPIPMPTSPIYPTPDNINVNSNGSSPSNQRKRTSVPEIRMDIYNPSYACVSYPFKRHSFLTMETALKQQAFRQNYQSPMASPVPQLSVQQSIILGSHTPPVLPSLRRSLPDVSFTLQPSTAPIPPPLRRLSLDVTEASTITSGEGTPMLTPPTSIMASPQKNLINFDFPKLPPMSSLRRHSLGSTIPLPDKTDHTLWQNLRDIESKN